MKHDSDQPLVVADDMGNLIKESEREYQIAIHGQTFVDIPKEVNELKVKDGDETLKIGKAE
jgi:hypothetical protein